MRRLRYGGIIQQAIKTVPITEILRSMGVDAPAIPPFGTSIKIYCPNNQLHADGGAEKEARLYADGKVYCHVCIQQYDVVSLAAQAWGCRPMVAARQLLEGREVVEATAARGEALVLRSGALAALAVWADSRGIDRFSDVYIKCVISVDSVRESEDVFNWIDACKRFLQ